MYSVAILGSSSRTAAWPAIKVDEDEAERRREKKDEKLLKRKLLVPKDGWLDKKGTVLHSYNDRHHLMHHVSDIF